MARTPKNGPLDSAQLAELARAALDNAQSLVADAQLLLKAGRWARAYALAILAAEEYGKFEACMVCGSYAQDDDELWNKFWKGFRDHELKLETWGRAFVDFFFTLPTMDHSEWVKAWNKLADMVQVGRHGKLAGFYVDFADGQVSDPATVASEDAARETVVLVDVVIGLMARSFEGDLTRLVSAATRFVERTLPMAELSELRAAGRNVAT